MIPVTTQENFYLAAHPLMITAKSAFQRGQLTVSVTNITQFLCKTSCGPKDSEVPVEARKLRASLLSLRLPIPDRLGEVLKRYEDAIPESAGPPKKRVRRGTPEEEEEAMDDEDQEEGEEEDMEMEEEEEAEEE